ncbi:MAG: hypothetical protein MUF77_01885 [Leptospira sp.]|jgi:hypothetical protein|nr:hypothetical protein [Leptospira sp.]
MKFIIKAILLVAICATINCRNTKEEDLIDGFKLSGDKDLDLLILLAATNQGSPCQKTIETGSTAFTYEGPSLTICGGANMTGTITFPESGNYKVTVKPGSIVLSSPRCNSVTVTTSVLLKDNTTSLISSSGGETTSTLALTSGKTYTIDYIRPSTNFSCLGAPPSIRVNNFQIIFTKE